MHEVRGSVNSKNYYCIFININIKLVKNIMLNH
jgi:hypothetical protein